jgi:hypothetical protein
MLCRAGVLLLTPGWDSFRASVSECVITSDGKPSYSASIMEFAGEFVAHEPQYFADPFERRSGG